MALGKSFVPKIFNCNKIEIESFRVAFRDCTFNEDIYDNRMNPNEKKLMFKKGDRVDCIYVDKTCGVKDIKKQYAQLHVWTGLHEYDDYEICHEYEFDDKEGCADLSKVVDQL
jgi:hypothetical protein